ncbi:hypothetical protein ACTFIV_004639 [Dictyostelium citrinum]
MKLIHFLIYFLLFATVSSVPPYYGIFELATIRDSKNLFLFRGANPNAYSLTPSVPGVIVSFFRYTGESNIYYSHRIQIVENLNDAAPLMTQTPNNLATSGRMVGYAYQEISREVFQGLNVANLNQLINGENLITPAGPFYPIGKMVNVLALLGRWIRLNFTPNIQPTDYTDDHPQKFSRPSESYDSQGGGSGVSNDLQLAYYQKNPNGNYYLEQRKKENGQVVPPENGLLDLVQQGTQVVKEAANGVKITGVNIWNKAKGIFNRGKDTVSSKTSSAIVKVEKEGNVVVKAGESVVTSVKKDGNILIKDGESVIDAVKKEEITVIKTGETIIEATKKEGTAVIAQGGAAIVEVEKDGAQFARGAEEMGEAAGEIMSDLGRATAGRVAMDVLEVV